MNIPTETRDIPIKEIRVMIHRARMKEGFEDLKASMAEYGLRYPIQVRDKGRRDADGIRYELICGEGRLTAAEQLKWKTIPALIIEAESAEIAGRFLAENMIRKPLVWAQKGRLIREEIKAGTSFSEIAERLHISEGHARKYLRVLDKAATEIEDEVAAMPMNDAEVFTTLPAEGQKLVMEVAKASKIPVREVVKTAKKLEEKSGAGWTKAALEKALRKVDTDLEAIRRRLKALRLHHALGPQNIRQLLKSREFRHAAETQKLNLSKFE